MTFYRPQQHGPYTNEDLIQAKRSENKGFNESNNGSARVINLCTFLSQPMQNKQVHSRGIIFIKRFLHEFSCGWYLSKYQCSVYFYICDLNLEVIEKFQANKTVRLVV